MTINSDIERRLWAAADQLWANASLRPSEFSGPVRGLIFLRYADHKFAQAQHDAAWECSGNMGANDA